MKIRGCDLVRREVIFLDSSFGIVRIVGFWGGFGGAVFMECVDYVVGGEF